MSQRYSTLTQITPQNVKNLELQWMFQARSLEKFEATPLVVDGIMYTVQAPNDVVALDAVTGRVFWTYAYVPARAARPCCGAVNRGLAILGDTLFMGTIDAHLIALDAKSGKPIWNVTVAKAAAGYALTHAPLVIKDKVIVGTAGGEYGIRGFIAAYDAKTGKEAWRFYTIPGKGEPGNETWTGDSWQHGGASVWVTGSYDPALNLTYWGIGNPGPDWNGDDARRRQPLQRLRGGARSRYREAEMVLPVHAARQARLRFGAGSGAGGHGVAGPAAQGDAVGQSQRVLLRARPDHRTVPDRQAVRTR